MKRITKITLSILYLVMLIPIFSLGLGNSKSVENVEAFLINDQTDKNEYIIGEYVCRDFAIDVTHNARGVGFNARVFYVHFNDDSNVSHALVVFHTTEGDIYADVTCMDAIVDMDFENMIYTSRNVNTGVKIYSKKIDWYMVDPREY